MGAIIHFKCRACDRDLTISPSSEESLTCMHCRAKLPLFGTPSLVEKSIVTTCVSCGHDHLYVQKDFNRNAGVAIVAIGITASIYFFARSEPMLAMASLGLTALVDFLAYFLVREVTVCYACHAVYRGFNRNPEHEPFDLKKLEKYGGRTPRGALDPP